MVSPPPPPPSNCRGLFDWLLPPVIRLVESSSTSSPGGVPAVTNSLCRYALELFSTSMTEAIAGLKEKKYLRSWLQAAFLFSVVWSFGGALAPDGRAAFDAAVRDALMGKSARNPLPAVLNNKFDAVPPTEGALFDFAFDFKGRGQWKHWGDAVKNAADSASSGVLSDLGGPFVPTVDSVRFQQLQSLARRNARPFLLAGPAGCGKTAAATALIRGAAAAAPEARPAFFYTALRNSEAEEFTVRDLTCPKN